jgi:hypothetical protein
MSGFILEYTTKSGGFVEVAGDNVKYWVGTGLPDYEGSTEGFTEMYPAVVSEMINKGVISHV